MLQEAVVTSACFLQLQLFSDLRQCQEEPFWLHDSFEGPICGSLWGTWWLKVVAGRLWAGRNLERQPPVIFLVPKRLDQGPWQCVLLSHGELRQDVWLHWLFREGGESGPVVLTVGVYRGICLDVWFIHFDVWFNHFGLEEFKRGREGESGSRSRSGGGEQGWSPKAGIILSIITTFLPSHLEHHHLVPIKAGWAGMVGMAELSKYQFE